MDMPEGLIILEPPITGASLCPHLRLDADVGFKFQFVKDPLVASPTSDKASCHSATILFWSSVLSSPIAKMPEPLTTTPTCLASLFDSIWISTGVGALPFMLTSIGLPVVTPSRAIVSRFKKV